MGFADNIKNAVDKGRKYAEENADKVDGMVDKAGDLIDQRTDNKFSDKVDQAQEAAKKSYRDGEQAPAEQPQDQAPVEQAQDQAPAEQPQEQPPVEQAQEQAPVEQAPVEQPQQ